jgi:aspartate carbamoyltransferase catalytic subunit
MEKRSLISITDLRKEEILRIMELAADFERDLVGGGGESRGLLQGRVIATLFFEPSTRTRLSFESAINRLGARVNVFSDVANTSVSKGETLHDTISVISNYCDMIVMRHTLEGAARYASEVAKVPVVNAGDGANQHPSQTLLDLYSIVKTQWRLDGLKVMMVGDLKYGRTVHSLLEALSHFDTEFVFVSPPELRMPAEYRAILDAKGLKYSESTELDGNMRDVDILYMTRIQKERFNDPMEYERVKNTYVLRGAMLEGVRETMKVLHPLPRVGEIAQDVDDSPHAYYFMQVENGVYARMAIICYLLGIKK